MEADMQCACQRFVFFPLVAFCYQVGDVTILVNNAAVVHGKSLMDSDDDALLKSQHINTMGQFWVSRIKRKKMHRPA